MTCAEYECFCGRLLLGVHGHSICLCDWITGDRIEKTLQRMKKYMPESHCRDDGSLLRRTATLLDDYFAGQLKEFDIPLALYGTEFQLSVWNVLRMVPYGVTATYKAVAEATGHPRGVRAVASAVGANPVSILIPCHRIIGSDGTLTGYAGGIEAKRRLLQLECQSHD